MPFKWLKFQSIATCPQNTSFCPLGTSMGAMHGSYRMGLDDGERFDAAVAPFTLADPLDMN